MTYRSVKVRKDPECPICGKNPTITELIDYDAFCGAVSEDAQQAAAGSTISATDLKDMQDSGENIYLVDVREPNEYEIVSIPGATLIPKDQFLTGAALERMPQDKRMVLHCKAVSAAPRSLAVVQSNKLRRRGACRRRRAGWIQPGGPVPCRYHPPLGSFREVIRCQPGPTFGCGLQPATRAAPARRRPETAMRWAVRRPWLIMAALLLGLAGLTASAAGVVVQLCPAGSAPCRRSGAHLGDAPPVADL
jgi:hypothetical protein